MINVLLVDDHELVRTGIELLLNGVEGISVIGSVDSGEQALIFAEQYVPDIVLMDIYMPGIGGIEACRRILQAHSSVKIIALSAYNDNHTLGQLLKLGVMGFLSKSSTVGEMVEAIYKVISGEPYLCKGAAQDLTERNIQRQASSPFAQLSAQEMKVVNLILQGYGIQEMAIMLNIRDKTINTYRYRIYEKLTVKNDVELTWLAIKFNSIDTVD